MGMDGATITNAFCKMASRLCETHDFDRKKTHALPNERLVYAKHTFPKSSVVSSTRDAIFFDKLPSRLRETPDFKKRHSSTSVSSTRNAHLQNQVSSRLRETLLFFTKMRLAYAKPLLLVADHAIKDVDGWGNDRKYIL